MSDQPVWEAALSRYAGSLYRLALLHDPHPARAARAVVAAFTAIDWQTQALDDRLEGQLVAALPPPRARLGRQRLAPLPPAFWRLPAAARLALGLRLTRGFSTDAIAGVLGSAAEDVRRMLCEALAVLAGDDPALLAAECRRSRMRRLDDAGAERGHLLSCMACREAAPRWERTERALAEAITLATGSATLPCRAYDDLARRSPALSGPAAVGRRQQALLLPMAITLVVLGVVAALVLPRRQAPAAARLAGTPRDLLRAAVARYGAAPEGEGIVHRRFVVHLRDPRSRLEAETWTDAQEPARHRMQLREGATLLEWQVGDGERALRYLTTLNDRNCGPNYAGVSLAIGLLNTWRMGAAEQEAMRAARWRFGPWAMGRRYLEQGLAADTVRSLGSAPEGDRTVLTLAAEGPAISGTLLIKLDARTADLREVREVLAGEGTAQAWTAWKIAGEEWITPEQARRTRVFLDIPARPRPREVERSLPVLDPACPLAGDENTVSPASVLGTGWPAVIGFQTPPPPMDRIYLLGHPYLSQKSGRNIPPQFVTLVYLGAQHRLALTALHQLRYQPDEALAAGKWIVTLRAAGPGIFEGQARPQAEGSGYHGLGFRFIAEGWSQEELLRLLASARRLELADWVAQRRLMHEPEPLPSAIAGYVVPALQALQPRKGAVQHTLVDYERREEPGNGELRDPYHAESPAGTLEAWAMYGADGRLEQFRSDARRADGTLREVEWGDQSGTRIFNTRSQILRQIPEEAWSRNPAVQLEERITNVFRYGQWEVSQDDPDMVTLQATLPISETDLAWVRQAQREQNPGAHARPWLADLEPEHVIYRTSFDRAAKRLLQAEVYARSPQGTTLLDRVTVRTFETGVEASPRVWSFQPPAGTPAVDQDPAGDVAWRGPQLMRSVPQAVAAAPAPLWGWAVDGGVHFVGALMPHPNTEFSFLYQTLENAVEAGAAAKLYYDVDTLGKLALLQGPPARLGALLQQTPAAWRESEQRTIRIAGMERQVWVMRNAEERWVIGELDGTLVVLHAADVESEELLWSALERLVPLD